MKLVNRIPVALFLGVVLSLTGLPHPAAADPNPGSPILTVWPHDPYSFQPGPGSTIASSYCGICHSAEYVYMQPSLSEESWGKIVHKMKSAFQCSIPDDQIPVLVEYLVGQNGIQPTSSVETANTQKPTVPNSQGNIGKGEAVYQKYCLNCHGMKGKGEGPMGQVLVPPPSDLTVAGKKSDKDLLQVIQNGRPGTAMPSWKPHLSTQEIQDVLAYIRSLGQ